METQVRLDESQNLAFDREYFGPREFEVIVDALRGRFERPVNLLDVGGGNGKFLDSLMASLPTGRVVNLDISAALLGLNKKNKVLIHASILDDPFKDDTEERKFDVITVNWVLHHMIGATERDCRMLQLGTLEACKSALRSGGLIAVAENDYRSWLRDDYSGRLIYAITRSRVLARFARRFANTAGVGVRFRTERGWRRLFDQAGLTVAGVFHGEKWRTRFWKRALLGMRAPRHVHFLLLPKADAVTGAVPE
jgi:hypothetical protein